MIKNSESSLGYLEKQMSHCLPGNSIDCVIFGYQNQELHILVLQWKHEELWALPGGFIHEEEDMDEAAQRILSDRTSLNTIFLKQFHTFGKKNRAKPSNEMQLKERAQFIKKLYQADTFMIDWLTKRFISTGYFALVDINKTNPKPDVLSEKCEWTPLKEMPRLIIDHDEIVGKALEQLRIQLNYLPVGMSLLPEKFTMQDLQRLYEAILQKPQERSNFQRKILKLNILIRHEKHMTGGSHRAPFLYSFDELKYHELLKNGIGFL